MRKFRISIRLSDNYKDNREIQLTIGGEAFMKAGAIKAQLNNMFLTLLEALSDTELEGAVNRNEGEEVNDE